MYAVMHIRVYIHIYSQSTYYMHIIHIRVYCQMNLQSIVFLWNWANKQDTTVFRLTARVLEVPVIFIVSCWKKRVI